MILCKFVHIINGNLHKTCHLVRKSARTAGTGSVHTDFQITLHKKNLSIFTTQLNYNIRFRKTLTDGYLCCIYFLYELDSRTLGNTHTCRTRNRTNNRFRNVEPVNTTLNDLFCLFGNHGVVTLITGMNNFILIVQNNALNCG